jgi:CHAT domain-containing protein
LETGRRGVSTVVTSLWNVAAATQALMVEFYQNLWTKNEGKLDALGAAQVALLDGRLKHRLEEAVRALGLLAPLPDGGAKSPSTRHPLLSQNALVFVWRLKRICHAYA